jgi:hypothetical protein
LKLAHFVVSEILSASPVVLFLLPQLNHIQLLVLNNFVLLMVSQDLGLKMLQFNLHFCKPVKLVFVKGNFGLNLPYFCWGIRVFYQESG